MILHKVRGKNFFSFGNAFTEFDIQKYNKSVLSGKNGEGKSSIPNMVTFALYGKPIKNVTKTQIINSINNKNCLVEIELSIGQDQYMIRRGIKPNVFEIYKNSVLVDQSSVNDYQDYLEENILGSSYRTFLQTSIISIENYKPFMSLTKAERRDFIEDILDIKVFTLMNQLVKSKVTKAKEELKLLALNVTSSKDKIKMLKTHIDSLESLQSNSIDDLNMKLHSYREDAANSVLVTTRCTTELSKLSTKKDSLKQRKQEKDLLQSSLISVKTNIRSIERELVFFQENDNCPTCTQSLLGDNIHTVLHKHNETHCALVIDRNILMMKLEDYTDIDDQISELNSKVSLLNSEVSVANANIQNANRLILITEKEILKLENSVDIKEYKDKMKVLAKEAMVHISRQTELNTEQDYNTIMLELFKDSGIKSKIVDQYIPIINKLVNQYLDKLNFFVSFNLDSEFNEVIKSRHRDTFTYSSFSAGEKMRIDVALLFTFRQLAKMKNSFSCNLLVLDEIMDASVDIDGIELLMNILSDEEFKQSNLIVISHANKEKFEDSFDGCYEIKKRDGFSEVHESVL